MILYYILILSFPLMRHPMFGRQIAGITVEKYIGIACLAYAILYAARRTRPFKVNRSTVLAYLLFYVLALVSYWFVRQQETSSGLMMLVYTSHLGFLIIAAIVIDSVRRLRWAMLACVASVGLASLYIIREWQKGVAQYGIGYRPGWVAGDANYFTASAIVGLLLAVGFLKKRNARWERLFAAATIIVSTFAILLASSRGGFLGLVAGFMFLVLHSQHRARNFAVVLILSAIALSVAPQSPLRRLIDPSYSDVEAVDSRLTTWSLGLRMIRNNPITGVGLGNFRATVQAYGSDEKHIAHNTYIEIGAEMGVPSLLVFVGLLVSSWVALERSRRMARRLQIASLYDATIGLQAGLLSVTIAIFFLSAEFLKDLWFMIFLPVVLPQVLAASKSKMKRAVPVSAGDSGAEPAMALESNTSIEGQDQDCLSPIYLRDING